jgi:hypothetical protein
VLWDLKKFGVEKSLLKKYFSKILFAIFYFRNKLK